MKRLVAWWRRNFGAFEVRDEVTGHRVVWVSGRDR